MRTTKAHRAANEAAQHAARLANQRRIYLSNLGHRAASVRGLDHAATTKLLNGLQAGTITLDPIEVAKEIEAYLSTVRCHEHCKAHVREYGRAAYKADPASGYNIGAHLCEVCATPMGCKNPDGKHTYEALSMQECARRKIYHGGNCYHVNVCTGCGHVHSVDSSD